MNIKSLSQARLFQGMTVQELTAVLSCLGASEKSYKKGALILKAGDNIQAMGLVETGSVHIESIDVWGNRSILSHVGAGELFAETYATLPDERLLVNAQAAEDTTVLYLNVKRLLTTCSASCTFHSRLIQNLLAITSQKNLKLSRRIIHTSSKSIRARLLSYLSEEAQRAGRLCFTIPFNRQELADYLNVERSALSAELSKMRRDGLLSCVKNKFELYSGE